MALTSSIHGTITGSGTTLVGLLDGNIQRTLKYDVANGSGPYVHNIRVGNFGCVDGESIDIITVFGASTNPTINIIDAWSNVTLTTTSGSGSIESEKASIFYCATNSSWELTELS